MGRDRAGICSSAPQDARIASFTDHEQRSWRRVVGLIHPGKRRNSTQVYEIVQHTADVRMQISASSREELFAEAARGLMDLIKPEGIQHQQIRAQIHVAAPDSTSLLVDFLNEVLTRCHIHREVFPRVVLSSMTAVSLDAELEGHPVAGFGEDVKAVTYHEADVRERDGLWSTTLVFDI